MSEFGSGTYAGYHGPQYKGMTTRALYITMRDGVKIAADVLLPKGLPPGEKVPTILYQTRYWRARQYQPGLSWIERFFNAPLRFFTSHGYAMVLVDVRGTGASFGTRRHPWDPEEIQDARDIVDWIVAQPWSSGKVGGYGTSYSGTTAELLAVVQHPAVKAIVPRFNEFDAYTDIAFPGGIYLRAFIEKWAEANRSLDANQVSKDWGLRGRLLRGVKPVDGDKGLRLLNQAVRDHSSNISVDLVANQITFRDDDHSERGILIEDFNVYTFQEQIERSGVPIYGWGGWFDAGTADAVIRRFMTFRNPQLAVVGPWNHGASQHASPYKPGPADVRAHWLEVLRFLDCHLKGVDTGVMDKRVLYYYTVGEEKWKETPLWPPAGSTTQRWYLAADHTLSRQKPDEETGADVYTVDFEASTGITNRWHTQKGGGPVLYPDRAQADGRLLVYTSPPLAEDTEITGYPVLTLHLTSTATDGAFFAYLEDVDEAGQVTYLAEGQLRALHRHVSADPPPYTQFVPYHSFKRQDGMPLVPGEETVVAFGLLPISVLIKKGHRIRVAIAGADSQTFSRVPSTGRPVITVARNRLRASCIDLPVIERST
jgi:putative CocE/NonD family hydrolase